MEIMVSILTTAYNHAPYIAQALDSFLAQKTDYPFEVIVHDDASTDGTADIIREYAQRYPEIIRPVLQTENQFSQGLDVYAYMGPLVRGKYIAMCEGDDYWCDENKLQKQISYMEAHPECTFCFSNSYDVDVNSGIIGERSPVDHSRVFHSEELVAAHTQFIATATTVCRTDDWFSCPPELMKGIAQDVPFRNFLMTRGNAYGFEERFACYRRMTPGSYSERYLYNLRHNRDQFLAENQDYIDNYLAFDAYSGGRFHEAIQGTLNDLLYIQYKEGSDWKKLQQPLFKERYDRLSVKEKVIIYTKYHFPHALKAFRFLRYGKEGLKKKY